MAQKISYDALLQKVEELEKEAIKREKIERALATNEAMYRGIVEHTISGVVVYEAIKDGEDFIIIDFNRAAEKIEKIKKEDVLHKSVLTVFPGVKAFGLFDVFKRVWKTGKHEHHPVAVYKDERITGWRENFVYKLPSGEVVAVYSDETERKQSEEALKKAHEELYHLSQALENKVQERTAELQEKNKKLVEAERLATLGRMANRVAHELRNPLTVLGGFTKRMEKNIANDDPNRKYLEIITHEVAVLESKISEITKIENEEKTDNNDDF